MDAGKSEGRCEADFLKRSPEVRAEAGAALDRAAFADETGVPPPWLWSPAESLAHVRGADQEANTVVGMRVDGWEGSGRSQEGDFRDAVNPN
jgi:hypothetical protein